MVLDGGDLLTNHRPGNVGKKGQGVWQARGVGTTRYVHVHVHVHVRIVGIHDHPSVQERSDAKTAGTKHWSPSVRIGIRQTLPAKLKGIDQSFLAFTLNSSHLVPLKVAHYETCRAFVLLHQSIMHILCIVFPSSHLPIFPCALFS